MTKRLDPEIKALRAVHRALDPLDEEAKRRTVKWAAAFVTNRGRVHLPPNRRAA